MNRREYENSINLLEEIVIHFANLSEREIVEKICDIISDCDLSHFQTMHLLSGEIEDAINLGHEAVIKFRSDLAKRNEDSIHLASQKS